MTCRATGGTQIKHLQWIMVLNYLILPGVYYTQKCYISTSTPPEADTVYGLNAQKVAKNNKFGEFDLSGAYSMQQCNIHTFGCEAPLA